MGELFDEWWCDLDMEIYYFIGKDIMYFYILFWLGMFKMVGFNFFMKVYIYGFFIVNKKKMFKSDGMFICVVIYDKYFDFVYLRYYYVFKLGVRFDDLDFDLEEFEVKVNVDFVGKVVNLVSCLVKFVVDIGLLEIYLDDVGFFEYVVN